MFVRSFKKYINYIIYIQH